MYLLTLVLGIVLLPEANTLTCYECIPLTGTCTETTTLCPTHRNQCAALVASYTDGSKVWNVNAKSCVAPEECGQYSANFGVSRTVIASKCCSTDLCNTQPAPEPNKTNPNGRKCFSCGGEICNTTLNCLGNEDYCISATVSTGGQNVTLKGCSSNVICTNKELAQIMGLTGVDMSCCQGDYCNSASSTGAGLMLLVAPLISLVLS
ncbi:urokinase plasminogen activator surface receptor-like isoform X3 [Mugil cephalus]|uniref:urokinase plasminogen activator surface receptor-like isoform X3 n=1 Tax=Mugil cephalus TaxID=48193 RepID=UPI001FB5D94B|nr:urokinase plasminogen activator surface receptor-like isoform X3 [Mugil cephalus]